MSTAVQLMFMHVSSYSHAELVQTLLSRLHKTEQARYRSFTNPQRQQTWLAGRALLLAALQRQLGQIDAASIRTDEQGGVRFSGNAVHLSMSHSRDMLVVSLARMRTGVDIEWPQPRNVLQHAERVFNPCEAEQLSSLVGAELSDAFYILWTLKEAVCKAAEVSLWESLQCTLFDLHHGRFGSLPPFPAGDWCFMSASIEPGWRVSVATRGTVNTGEIECWRMTAAQHWHRQPLVRQVFLSGEQKQCAFTLS